MSESSSNRSKLATRFMGKTQPFAKMSESSSKRSKLDTRFMGETEFTHPPDKLVAAKITDSSKSMTHITLGCGYGNNLIINAIGQCVQLQELTVCTCSLYFNQNEFGTELQKCVNLRSLSVTNHCGTYDVGIDTHNADMFLNSMVTNTHLQHIDFTDTSMSIDALTGFLRRCPNLISVYVNECIRYPPESVSFEGCFSKSLEYLFFSENKIGDLGAIALAKVLPNCVELICLQLNKNLIRDIGATALMAALPASLTQLELSDNGITGVGVAPLLENLGDSNIIDYGKVSAAVAAFPPWHQLQVLDLSENFINDHGALELAKVLPNFKNLIKLNLNDNAITDLGARAFIQVIPKCAKLDNIFLGGTNISDLVLERIRSLLRKQPDHYAIIAKPVENKTNWNRRRHISFGKQSNDVFAAFLLGLIKEIKKDNSAVPDADPEMIEETLEALHYYGLTISDLKTIMAAGTVDRPPR